MINWWRKKRRKAILIKSMKKNDERLYRLKEQIKELEDQSVFVCDHRLASKRWLVSYLEDMQVHMYEELHLL
jgi:hypothetical protein